jgi:hydrogenase expression/formation protein HypC
VRKTYSDLLNHEGSFRVCLGIPGQVVEIVDDKLHIAKVEVSGVRRDVQYGLVAPEGLSVGDWVLIHVGFAMSKIDEAEAHSALDFLKLLGGEYEEELDGLRSSDIA